jgi:hypothetical protein
MLGVDLDGSRRIEAAHVGCLVGSDGSRRIQTDRLDDHRHDQGASDRTSDGKASGDPEEDVVRYHRHAECMAVETSLQHLYLGARRPFEDVVHRGH